VRARDAGNTERDQQKRMKPLIRTSVKNSDKILLAMEPDAVNADELNDNIASLSVAYLSSPPAPMLEHGFNLRKEVFRRIREGAARPHELSDLYVAAGRASGIHSYAALDLGDADAAATHARVAWLLSDRAAQDELRAWVRGTESLIVRFQKNYAEAASNHDGLVNAVMIFSSPVGIGENTPDSTQDYAEYRHPGTLTATSSRRLVGITTRSA
jgi:hypothetical protein